ncbi:amidase-like isoform X1 [Branchiostoma floridae]|uniref:Amidase-like isoform X1 n=1 Tax=Branchiostoma floridae TaxID=7739 RepID=A0A9J7L6P1_BRAFL|nr:amidase-like isoform X1 [Branchiostoma floridae]
MQGGAASTASALYSPSAVRTPSLQQLSQSAAKFNLDIDEAELKQYQDVIKEALVSYDRVDKMTEPIPAVKWPRTPGWRPDPEDNPHNAWYFRTEITGASTGKLHGKTVAIKDNVAVAGVPMMNGSRIMEGYVPDYDATIVTRILDAGGSIKGKSSCEDLCLSGDSFTSVTGPVLNAHDRTRSAGGSSSGSATLLALEQVDMATGGDQGGSIRIPAAWSGVVGLKPTYGLVPYTGCVPVDITLDHVGPMARTVDDVALMLEVIAGYDNGLDPRQPANLTVPEYTKQLTGDLGGIRVGLLKEGFGSESAEADVDELVRAQAHRLTSAGAVVEDMSVPLHYPDASHIYNVINEGCLETMIKGNGLGVGWKGFYPTSMLDALAKGYRTRAHDMPPTGKFTYLLYDCITTNYGNRFYAKGQNLSRMLTHAYNQALSRYDVIIMPTIPFKATKLPNKDISTSEICKMALNFGQMSNVCPFNLTGHPALSINAGFSQGLPVGMMIVGRHFDDATVLKVAHAFENIRDSKI